MSKGLVHTTPAPTGTREGGYPDHWLMIKAEISRSERNRLKAMAALSGISAQKLVGSLIRRYLHQ